MKVHGQILAQSRHQIDDESPNAQKRAGGSGKVTAQHATLLRTIPAAEIPGVLVELSSLQAALAARLLGERSVSITSTESHPNPGQGPSNEWVSVDEVVERLKVKRKWLYRNKHLFECRRISRKKLLFSTASVDTFLARAEGQGSMLGEGMP